MEVREPCGQVSGAQSCWKKCWNGQEAIERLFNRDRRKIENANLLAGLFVNF